MEQVIIERSELLVVIDAETQTVRVWENTLAAEEALNEWQAQSTAFENDEIEEVLTLEEWMDEKGIKSFTTTSRWLLF